MAGQPLLQRLDILEAHSTACPDHLDSHLDPLFGLVEKALG